MVFYIETALNDPYRKQVIGPRTPGTWKSCERLILLTGVEIMQIFFCLRLLYMCNSAHVHPKTQT